MRHDEFDLDRTVVICGAPFEFRTLHGSDARFGEKAHGPLVRTLDRIVTVTLPAIEGYSHKMKPTMKVTL